MAEQADPKKEVTIYTDGACSRNPGQGGAAWLLIYKDAASKTHVKPGSRAYKFTTNNRMELVAVIEALKALKVACRVTVYTDSRYIVDTFDKRWYYRWESNNFVGVKNVDLWKMLLDLVKKHRVRFVWVRGHDDNAYNEDCDKRAVAASLQLSDVEEDTEYKRLFDERIARPVPAEEAGVA